MIADLSNPSRQAQVAEFVRQFFLLLEHEGVTAAVLHGGNDGFAGELTDVDFVVRRQDFAKLPLIINHHCQAMGWRLCQVLRHEDTCGYFVCCDSDEPRVVVALDACSDFQRNGMVFQSATELLVNRRALPWGGFGLSEEIELQYRLVKAAGKDKSPSSVIGEFLSYPTQVRISCQKWLTSRWGLNLRTWDTNSLASLFPLIRKKSFSFQALFRPSAIRRVWLRVIAPTGVIVVTGNGDARDSVAMLESVFSHLYFRHVCKADRWQPSLLKNLISSTLIVVPELSDLWHSALPANCIYHLNPSHAPETHCREVVNFLYKRYNQREELV